MGIWIDRETPLLIQGITGIGARRHLSAILGFGTNVVAGTSLRGEVDQVEGIPVYRTVQESVDKQGVEATLLFVPGGRAREAVSEAVDAGMGLIVCMPEDVSAADAFRMREACRSVGARLIGPNTNGICTPGEACAGFFPPELNMAGDVGIVSSSGTMAYGAMLPLQAAGLGQSSVIGVGGAAFRGTTLGTAAAALVTDEATRVVVVLGEIGGVEEHDFAQWMKSNRPDKKVIALIAGRHAPVGVSIGHARALVKRAEETWKAKVDALRSAGVTVVDSVHELVSAASA